MLKQLAIIVLTLIALFAAACSKSDETDTPTDPGGGGGGGGGGGTTGAAVTISSVDGLAGTGMIHAGQTITIHFWFTNNTGKSITGSTNGIEVYSPDGANWNTATIDTSGVGKALYDGGVFLNYFSVNGTGADTVGFGGFRLTGSGIPDGYDAEGFSLILGPISAGYVGKQICVDSAFYPPGGAWLWALDGGGNAYPEWGGPYCWTITN